MVTLVRVAHDCSVYGRCIVRFFQRKPRYTQVIRVLVGRFGDIDPIAATIKLHKAIDQGKKCEIVTLTDAFAGVKFIANLADQNITSSDRFATKSLYSTSLGVRVATVSTGTLTFFMCHLYYLKKYRSRTPQVPKSLKGIAIFQTQQAINMVELADRETGGCAHTWTKTYFLHPIAHLVKFLEDELVEIGGN